MKIDSLHTQVPIDPFGSARKPRNIEEAAKQFEAILARQLVRSMTDGLFKSNFSGEDGPAWMEGYNDTQRDLLTGVLADHLVKSGKLKLSDMLLRSWENLNDGPSDSAAQEINKTEEEGR
jgi:Rod binding domain-containing protein